MIDHFKEFEIKSLDDNIFSLLDSEWMLITAGNINSLNTMTASWGGFGILWNMPVAFIFIRPQRYTLKFVENKEIFTLSFFEEKYREILNYCGSKSGKDVDKIAETRLDPVETAKGGIFFNQSRLMIECRKIYCDRIKPENFNDSEIEEKIYRNKDYHHLFIGEIITCMKRI